MDIDSAPFGARLLALVALLAALSTSDAAAEPPPEAQPPGAETAGQAASALTLERYLRAYLEASPQLRSAALGAGIAALEWERVSDRRSAALRLTPGVRYGQFLFGGGSPTVGLGSAHVSDAALELEDGWGGTTVVGTQLLALTDPALSAGGHEGHLFAQYALPLLRNAFGRLYRLEARSLEHSLGARTLDAEAALIEGCSTATELFAHAWRIQAQLLTWQELYELKERVFEQTLRDFRRRLVPELDALTAESDWLATRQRDAALRASSEEALARLMAPLAGPGGPSPSARLELPELSVASPAHPGELETALAAHPRARALERDAAARNLDGELAWERSGAEVALVPRAGVSHYSQRFQPPGANASLTDLNGSLSLQVELPLLDPTRRQRREVHRARARRLMAEREAVLDSLEARALSARANAGALTRRLELHGRREEVLRRQLAEARRRFQSGRLQYQDLLLHWAQYEDARFEGADLRASLLLTAAEARRALGVPHPACEVAQR